MHRAIIKPVAHHIEVNDYKSRNFRKSGVKLMMFLSNASLFMSEECLSEFFVLRPSFHFPITFFFLQTKWTRPRAPVVQESEDEQVIMSSDDSHSSDVRVRTEKEVYGYRHLAYERVQA